MATNTERDARPTWSAHTLVMTLLEGDEPFNGHCTCDRWSCRTNDWADLGARWARHYAAGSGRPGGHPAARAIVRRELEARGEYGGDCAGCGHPVIRGRTHCRECEQDGVVSEEDHGDNCELNCCWEATVARRHARDAAHQRMACGNCLDCDDERSPDHEDCICPLGRAIPVEVAA